MRDLRAELVVLVFVTLLSSQHVSSTASTFQENLIEYFKERGGIVSKGGFLKTSHSSSKMYSGSSHSDSSSGSQILPSNHPSSTLRPTLPSLENATFANTSYESTYILVVPTFIRPHMMLNIGVTLPKSDERTRLSAILTTGEKVVATMEGTFSKYKSSLLSMKLPDDMPKSYIYHLNVSGKGSVNFNTTHMLIYQEKQMSIFIQTDKPVYKPGDIVQFRAFAMFPTFEVHKEGLNITVFDPASNKVHRWLNYISLNGCFSGKFTLPPRPRFGYWRIQVSVGTLSSDKTILIMEYVKQLFEVNVIMPKYYAISTTTSLDFIINARHTNSKPVNGTLHVIVKLLHPNRTAAIEDIVNVTSFMDVLMPFNSGTSQFSIQKTQLEAVDSYLEGYTLSVEATVTDHCTEKSYSANGTVKFYSYSSRLQFPVVINPHRFKPGMWYLVSLKVSQPDGNPIPPINIKSKVIFIIKTTVIKGDLPQEKQHKEYFSLPPTYSRYSPEIAVPIPSDGIVSFPIETDEKAVKIEVTARHGGVHAMLEVLPAFSPSYSFVKLSLLDNKLYKVGDVIQFVVNATDKLNYYTVQIMARGELVHSERHYGHHDTRSVFYVRATAAMSPHIRIIVFYVRDNGEIVTDSYHMGVQAEFPNYVDLQIRQKITGPGQEIGVYMLANPNGHLYLHAIDQRVQYQGSISELTIDQMYSELDDYDVMWHKEFSGSARQYSDRPVSYGGKDAKRIFWNSGLSVLTDAFMYDYRSPFEPTHLPVVTTTEVATGLKELPKPPTYYQDPGRVPTHFPDSWLWMDVEVCKNGEATVFANVPKTMTSWVINGFSIHHRSGFGMPHTSSMLTVVKAFFVVVNVPWTPIVQGEELAIEVIIFNYMNEDQKVTITLPVSNTFTSVYRDCNDVSYHIQQEQVVSIQVKTGEVKSAYFPIVFLETGIADVDVIARGQSAADAVVQRFTVIAPGSRIEFNIPIFIDLTGRARAFSKTIDIAYPGYIVDGTERFIVAVFGDVLGSSLLGLDSLLSLPTGCGEQTMLSLAPDVYILNYLKAVDQMTDDIALKATNYMKIGYQQELSYKHPKGSFSAFGTNDESGSMWLTAFVARVFHQAKSHIFIDEDVIKKSIEWMIGLQHENGSFPEPGVVIQKQMQGNSGSGPSLTVFVLLALVENENLFDNTTESEPDLKLALEKCQAYLEAEVAKSSDLYFLSLAAYALQLAGSNQTDALMNRIRAKAHKIDNIVHWEYDSEVKTADHVTWRKPNQAVAIDVEITSYILATFALRKEVLIGRRIFSWLLSQRNAHGGFTSTQDTVAALNAMSLFAQLVYHKDMDIKTTVSMDNIEKFNFHIYEANAHTRIRRELARTPYHIKVDATGTGMTMVEMSIHFNVDKDIQETNFDVKVNMVNESNNFILMKSCISWTGDGQESGMTVQEMGIPTGFILDKSYIPKVDVLKMVDEDVDNNKVLFYFDKISENATCITVGFNRTGLTGRNKPSVIKVYDYYEPSHQKTYFYQSDTLAKLSICDVCLHCINCEAKGIENIDEVKGGLNSSVLMDADDDIEAQLNAPSKTTPTSTIIN